MNFKVKATLLFLAASLIPYIIGMFYLLAKSQDEHLQSRQNELLFELEKVADRIDNNLKMIEKDFIFISKLEVMNDIVSFDLDRRISEILLAKKNDLELQGDYTATDLKNNAIASSNLKNIGKEFAGKYLFKQEITSSFTGQKIGDLILEYKLENLKSFLKSAEGSVVYLYDSKNNVNYFKTQEFEKSITLRKPLKLLNGMELVMMVDKDAMLNLFKDLRNVTIISLVGGFLLILAVSLYFAKKIITPITRLSKTAIDISDTGDYTKRVLVESKDEIGMLSAAFNNMIESIEDMLARLKKESENKIKLQEEKSKNEMLESLSKKLSRYLSPQIFDSIFLGRQDVKIESKRKKLTIFFSDIVNFTETTDRMESEDLTAILNYYLNEMNTIALKHGATIDKFIGDAIMAFFGDPDTKGVKEDACACVDMALEMMQKIDELKNHWLNSGISRPFKIRIGINTGFSTVGNFGSEERMDYTIIGSAINLASRIESFAEPNEIWISEETYLLVSDKYRCAEKGEITVKGFLRPVKMYKVEGYKEKDENIAWIKEEKGFSITILPQEINKDRLKNILKEVLQKLG